MKHENILNQKIENNKEMTNVCEQNTMSMKLACFQSNKKKQKFLNKNEICSVFKNS